MAATGKTGNEYDIFLSHNRADKDWVRALAARIEAESEGRASCA